jgi:ABC-type sugar transport system ATPase subunit
MSYFTIQEVSKSYTGQLALHPISISLKRGDFLSIVGESGSGKSTLLRIMAGLEVQDAGQVFLKEMEIQSPKHKVVAGYPEIKLIYQDFHLFPNSTVAENIGRPLLQFDKSYAID